MPWQKSWLVVDRGMKPNFLSFGWLTAKVVSEHEQKGDALLEARRLNMVEREEAS